MSIAPYIKEIGRGKDGARALNAQQAEDLFSQVLAQRVSPAQVGAFCVAMRIKGETSAELQGFWAATHVHMPALPQALAAAQRRGASSGAGVVMLPSYNGARRLPNLTALLAQHLSRSGCCVLVHGLGSDPTRVTSRQVFEAAGLPVVSDDMGLASAWSSGLPAYMDISDLHPGLHQLLAMRWELGLRNPGHTIAKLIDPWALHTPAGTALNTLPRMRVVNHTHPEYAHSLTQFLQDTAANAMLMRGTEGEPVADARRQPRAEVFIQGQAQLDLSLAPQEGVLITLPDLPPAFDAQTTAAYMAQVMGDDGLVPPSITSQAQALISSLARQAAAR